MTAFLSTYVNKVDKKGRVSVPASYRAALADRPFQGLIAYPSLTDPAIEAFGRDVLERMNEQRLANRISGGDFEQALVGSQDDDLVETIMAMASEMPFDGEGRVILPPALVAHAGIEDRATFVGRGSRIQIWAPDRFEAHQADAVEKLRARLAQKNGGG